MLTIKNKIYFINTVSGDWYTTLFHIVGICSANRFLRARLSWPKRCTLRHSALIFDTQEYTAGVFMTKQSFIFYRSFYEAAQALSDEQKGALYNAIIQFALEQNEVATDPIVKAMFSLIKPQLEANQRRYENGTKGASHGNKGGRPSGKAILKDFFGNTVPDEIGDNQHFLYLIYDTERNLYKVGETKNLIKRRYHIKQPTANLDIFYFGLSDAYTCQQAEKLILKKYSSFIYSGDWLRISEQQAKEIKEIISKKTPNKTPNVNVNANVNANVNVNEDVNGNENENENSYKYHGKVIKLNEKDYNQWQNSYRYIDLDSELQRLDDYYAENNITNWWMRCSNQLSKKNQEVAQAKKDNKKVLDRSEETGIWMA